MRALQGHFREVTEEGQWQVVTIVGDAGVGKSRLVSDFAVWLDELDEPVWWFGGRAAPAAATVPFALLHDMFARRFGISGNDGPVEVRRKWEQGLEQALGASDDTVERAHMIALWLGFEIGDTATIAGAADPQSLSGRAATHLGEYLCRLAERAPVVLLLEDLHWADEATLALIHAAEPVLRDSSVLVVATSRPTLLEQHPHWGEGLDYHTRISLRSLSRRETRRLLDEILKGADRVPEALGDLVVTASEGNPFYVEELVNWFLESGVIRRDETGWRVFDDQLETAVVPPTLRSVLQARLDGLSPAERQALQRASVIGRVFWDDAVRSLAAGDPVPTDDVPIDDVLDQLRGRDLVHQRERSSLDDRREFLFKHALLRDVVYESMLRRHRRQYHELAAEWFADLAARSRARGRVRRHDRRSLRQRDERRIGRPLVPGRRASGGVGARPRGRSAPPDRRCRAGTDCGADAARRPAARARNGARPPRRARRPTGRPRCAGHARADPRRARPGAAGAGDAQPLPVVVQPQ